MKLLFLLALMLITAPPLVFTPPVLPDGTHGQAYSQTLEASGGVPPYKWMEDNPPRLPKGLSLGSTTGVISGIPITAGTYLVGIQVADSEKPAQRIQRGIRLVIQ